MDVVLPSDNLFLKTSQGVLYHGDALDILKKFPSEFVDCVVTSPPYWRLRDYGTDGQIGLENSIQEYLEKLWEIFDEDKRILKPTGTCWVVIGDTYMNNSSYSSKGRRGFNKKDGVIYKRDPVIKQKSLCMVPERFAIGMVERGWILRNQIIWCLEENTMMFVKRNGKYLHIPIKEIKIGDKIATVDKDLNITWVKVKNKFFTGVKRALKITTKSGIEVICSEEHRFPYEKEYEHERFLNPKFKQARDLKLQDKLFVNRRLKVELPKGSKEDYQKGFLVGLFLAKENCEEEENSARPSCPSSKELNKLVAVYVSGNTDETKHFSQEVWNTSIEFIKGIIDGLLNGNGYYDKKSNSWKVKIKPNKKLKNDLLLACRIVGYKLMHEGVSIDNSKSKGIVFVIKKRTETEEPSMLCPEQISSIENIECVPMYDIEVEPIYTSCCEEENWNNLYFLANGIWTHNCKPNAMPESVKDRFTVDYEKIFFFVKSREYYFKQQFEPHRSKPHGGQIGRKSNDPHVQYDHGNADRFYKPNGRNKRAVWIIPTRPFKEAHFAVFPPEIPRICIDAGCPPKGIVMDMFAGSGTTLVVAQQMDRYWIGIDINREYCKIAQKRLRQTITIPSLFRNLL